MPGGLISQIRLQEYAKKTLASDVTDVRFRTPKNPVTVISKQLLKRGKTMAWVYLRKLCKCDHNSLQLAISFWAYFSLTNVLCEEKNDTETGRGPILRNVTQTYEAFWNFKNIRDKLLLACMPGQSASFAESRCKANEKSDKVVVGDEREEKKKIFAPSPHPLTHTLY